MKRFRAVTAVIAAMAMLLSVMPLQVTAAWLGDVTRDDSVNMRDCMKLYQTVSSGAEADEEYRLLGDVTQDGTMNMRDCMKLYMNVSNGAPLVEVTFASEQPADTLTPVDPANYYGRLQLAAQGDRFVKAYDRLGEEINALNSNIMLYSYQLTMPEFERVMWHYRQDHPEVFWIDSTYSYYYYTNNGVDMVYSVSPVYRYSEGEVRSYQTMLENNIGRYLEGLTDAVSKADREKIIHDRLIKNASYDMTYVTEHAHDALGVMAYGTGVCESYARAFQLILYRAGIRSALVTGTTHSGEYHMWNVVELDDGWYQVDTTWDDPVFSGTTADTLTTYCTYVYYNLTTAQMLLDRDMEWVYSNFDDTYRICYDIPECTQTAANFHLSTATVLTKMDVATVGAVIAQSIKNDTVAVFRATGSYTLAQLKADIQSSATFWTIIDVANAVLSSDEKLTSPGYILKTNETYGVLEIYLRNM